MASRAPSTAKTFRFQIAWAVPESQMVAWFEQARPGERIEYCRGYVELREDVAWKLAGAWAREGLVNLVADRAPDDARMRCWLAERTSKGLAEPRRPRDRSDDVTKIQLSRLLDWLRRLADKDEPMPSFRTLALDLTGFKDRRARNRVSYLLERLAERGEIALIRAPLGARHGPQITILAKGRGQGKTTPVRGK